MVFLARAKSLFWKKAYTEQNREAVGFMITLIKYSKQSVSNPAPMNPASIYRYLNEDGACFVLLYVDDALLTGDPKTVQHIQQELTKHFKCKFNSPLDFLGLDIDINILPGKISLSMTSFTNKMLLAFSVKPWPYTISTPGRTDVKIIRGENVEPNASYRSKVGSLNWLTMGLRMDLVYTTKELSRVLFEPTAEANKILARTLQYIEQTKHARLDFTRDKMLNYQPPKTRKKPTDIVNPYISMTTAPPMASSTMLKYL
jgi:hypothetical protein